MTRTHTHTHRRKAGRASLLYTQAHIQLAKAAALSVAPKTCSICYLHVRVCALCVGVCMCV